MKIYKNLKKGPEPLFKSNFGARAINFCVVAPFVFLAIIMIVLSIIQTNH